MRKALDSDEVRKIITLHEKGFMQWEIAAAIGISNMTVTRYLRKHNQRVYDILAQDHAAERGRQVRHLVVMFREAINEWHRSKKEKGRVKVTEEGKVFSGKTIVSETRTEREVIDTYGNPAYLDRAQSILGAIREVMMMSKTLQVNDDKPVAGDNDVTKALEKLNMMARELKDETGKALSHQHGDDDNKDDDDDDIDIDT